jgi:hypothetical protein
MSFSIETNNFEHFTNFFFANVANTPAYYNRVLTKLNNWFEEGQTSECLSLLRQTILDVLKTYFFANQ